MPTDINDVIISSLDLMTPVLKDATKHIAVSLSLQQDLPKPNTNFNEIKQVVLNIIKNAAEAIDTQGTLKIRTAYNPRYAKHSIITEFSDSGKGIPKEIAKKVFDPFFTTKKGSGGTGLGLTVSRKIICENHNGTLTIDSRENEGTTVIMTLPINRSEAAASLTTGG
jgi:signal transduction histidine kinase